MIRKISMAVISCALAGATFAGEPESSGVRARIAAKHAIGSEDAWYGCRRILFDFKGHKACVVLPKGPAAKGMPWTWTIQWWSAFVDRTGVPQLLKAGWHHAWVDGFALRGNAEGLALFADFQRFLVEDLGFAPKANLIGMSWGGFFSTRYAAAHPGNVAKIYLDAPLLNFDGFGNPDYGRIGPWASAYRKGMAWSDNPEMPVNMADKIAAAKIPILLVYGGSDTVVPPAKNCELFAARFKAAGGEITIDKRGLFGHHPHGLDPDKTGPIVNFFTK